MIGHLPCYVGFCSPPALGLYASFIIRAVVGTHPTIQKTLERHLPMSCREERKTCNFRAFDVRGLGWQTLRTNPAKISKHNTERSCLKRSPVVPTLRMPTDTSTRLKDVMVERQSPHLTKKGQEIKIKKHPFETSVQRRVSPTTETLPMMTMTMNCIGKQQKNNVSMTRTIAGTQSRRSAPPPCAAPLRYCIKSNRRGYEQDNSRQISTAEPPKLQSKIYLEEHCQRAEDVREFPREYRRPGLCSRINPATFVHCSCPCNVTFHATSSIQHGDDGYLQHRYGG